MELDHIAVRRASTLCTLILAATLAACGSGAKVPLGAHCDSAIDCDDRGGTELRWCCDATKVCQAHDCYGLGCRPAAPAGSCGAGKVACGTVTSTSGCCDAAFPFYCASTNRCYASSGAAEIACPGTCIECGR